MILLFLHGWNIDNIIQAILVIITSITAFLLYRTFIEGRKQTEESLKLTRKNISISQYQIYIEELKYLHEMFRTLKFNVRPEVFNDMQLVEDIKKSNGINYLDVFTRLVSHTQYFQDQEGSLNLTKVNEFRQQVLFPLVRAYSILNNFLTRIREDELIQTEHKYVLFLIIERDFLPNYLRLCNNEDLPGKKTYNLSIFDTERFHHISFCVINQFYMDYDLFRLHSHQFYKFTL